MCENVLNVTKKIDQYIGIVHPNKYNSRLRKQVKSSSIVFVKSRN